MISFKRRRLLRRAAFHHLPLAGASFLCVSLLYFTRPYPDAITRSSFATAYPALAMLSATLWLGPWDVLRRRRPPVSSDLRRDVGIWAGILGIVHTSIGLFVHLRGRPWLYFLYGSNEGDHPFLLRHDLFGFANYTGALATAVLVVLFATSNDCSLRALGTSRWKQLQRWSYALFVLALLHAAAYQLLEKQHADFVAATAVFGGVTVVLQFAGYQRRRAARAHTASSATINL